MTDYRVSISNIFEAESPQDAVLQMVAYLIDYADRGGYRVDVPDTWFIDAESLDALNGRS